MGRKRAGCSSPSTQGCRKGPWHFPAATAMTGECHPLPGTFAQASPSTPKAGAGLDGGGLPAETLTWRRICRGPVGTPRSP